MDTDRNNMNQPLSQRGQAVIPVFNHLLAKDLIRKRGLSCESFAIKASIVAERYLVPVKGEMKPLSISRATVLNHLNARTDTPIPAAGLYATQLGVDFNVLITYIEETEQ